MILSFALFCRLSEGLQAVLQGGAEQIIHELFSTVKYKYDLHFANKINSLALLILATHLYSV